MLRASETWPLIKWKLTSVFAAQSHQGYRLTILTLIGTGTRKIQI